MPAFQHIYPWQVYLQAAALYLWESSGDRSGVESISGVWLSSDDSSCLPEVQELAGRYFPNVQIDKIVTISFRDNGPAHPNYTGRDELPTTSKEMVRILSRRLRSTRLKRSGFILEVTAQCWSMYFASFEIRCRFFFSKLFSNQPFTFL